MTPGQQWADAWVAAWQHANGCPACRTPGEDAWAGCPAGRTLDDALARAYRASRRMPQPAGGVR